MGEVTEPSKPGARRSSITARVYRALGVFSGTQSVGILCSIVRTKLVSIWVNAVGVGLFGIYNAAVEMISSVTQLSLRNSAVRDLAMHPADSEARALTQAVVARWGVVLGLIGMLLTLACSPLLARFALGDAGRWGAFALLSPVLLMTSVNNSQQAIMQADGRLGALAKSSLWGAVCSLVAAVPLLYWFRFAGIIPVILTYSGASLATTLYYRRRYCAAGARRAIPRPSMGEMVAVGRSFLRLGFFMTLSGAVSYGATFCLMAWLRLQGGEELVGYYQAGSTLLIRYAGILFTAIGMEYYPRIAAAGHSCRRLTTYANHEIVTLLRVAIPLALVFVVGAPWIVWLLYDEQFLVVTPMVTIGTIGLIARIAAWCIAFMMIVRDDVRLYTATELASTAMFILFSMGGYALWGLTGLGWAFTAWYLAYLALVWAVSRRRYGFRLRRRPALWLLVAFLLTIAAAAASQLLR